MQYIVMDIQQDYVYNNFNDAVLKALKLGYNTIKDNKGNKYFI
jgi:hypothetical protein